MIEGRFKVKVEKGASRLFNLLRDIKVVHAYSSTSGWGYNIADLGIFGTCIWGNFYWCVDADSSEREGKEVIVLDYDHMANSPWLRKVTDIVTRDTASGTWSGEFLYDGKKQFEFKMVQLNGPAKN